MKPYDLFGTKKIFIEYIFFIIKIFYGKCVIVASMPEKFPYFFLQTFKNSSRSRLYFIIEKKNQTKGYLSFTQLSNIYLIVSKFT